MRRLLLCLLGALSLLAWTGCAEDKPRDPNAVSSIPWNRPERWESQGPMGGMMPGSH